MTNACEGKETGHAQAEQSCAVVLSVGKIALQPQAGSLEKPLRLKLSYIIN